MGLINGVFVKKVPKKLTCKNNIKIMKQLFYILIILFVSLNGYSTDYSTNQDGNWTVNLTWQDDSPPSSTDNAIINNNHDIIIDSSDVIIIKELTMLNNSTLTINGDLTIDSLHINNRADLVVNGTLTVLGGVTMSNKSVLNINVNGDVDVQGDFVTGNNVGLIVDGTMNINGDLTLATGSSIAGTGSITVEGTVDIPDGSDPGTVVNSTLPIELLSFNATFYNNHVVLDWDTTSEINNDYFTIEKSSDGVNFEILNIINGAGNSNNILSYKVIDNNPLEGTSYYRLKQTDYDGKFEYSSIIYINNILLLNENILYDVYNISGKFIGKYTLYQIKQTNDYYYFKINKKILILF